VGPQVVRYSERPEFWDAITGLSDEVWPEYNQHGATLNHYWDQLYEVFPDWQFVLYDPGDETVLAEGHTIPVAWDGTDTGLGPGIDATVTAAFELRAATVHIDRDNDTGEYWEPNIWIIHGVSSAGLQRGQADRAVGSQSLSPRASAMAPRAVCRAPSVPITRSGSSLGAMFRCIAVRIGPRMSSPASDIAPTTTTRCGASRLQAIASC
jgi:hypothetical protein